MIGGNEIFMFLVVDNVMSSGGGGFFCRPNVIRRLFY